MLSLHANILTGICFVSHCTNKFSTVIVHVRIMLCAHLSSRKVITTNFCTCHDSFSVMACAKICVDQATRNWNPGNLFFLSNFNYDGNIMSDMVPCRYAILRQYHLGVVGFIVACMCHNWSNMTYNLCCMHTSISWNIHVYIVIENTAYLH